MIPEVTIQYRINQWGRWWRCFGGGRGGGGTFLGGASEKHQCVCVGGGGACVCVAGGLNHKQGDERLLLAISNRRLQAEIGWQAQCHPRWQHWHGGKNGTTFTESVQADTMQLHTAMQGKHPPIGMAEWQPAQCRQQGQQPWKGHAEQLLSHTVPPCRECPAV